jgi:zinc transport system ATP-binding protein
LDKARPIVELCDLSVKYSNGVLALDRITLDVNDRDLIGLIGPNGAGKSTLLSVILGLIKPTSGSVKLFGNRVLTKNLKYVGYVPQKAQAQDPNFPFTVFETVMLGRTARTGLLRRLGAGDKQKVVEALKLFGIYELKDRKIGQLSGGQSQRVFVAKSIVAEPKLLLLDEPTSGVDVASKAEFYDILERLNKEMGITIMLSSHDIGVVTKLANRVVCINRSLFFCGQKSDFSANSVLPKMYDYPVEMMHHDHA